MGIACVQTSPLPPKKNWDFFSEVGRTSVHRLYGKKPIVSVTYENERISMKNSLPYLKCVLRLSCVVHGLIFGRFMGLYVNTIQYNTNFIVNSPWGLFRDKY